MAQVFTHPTMPTVWIVAHDGRHYIVPAVWAGWEKRRLFRGDTSRLEVASQHVQQTARALRQLPHATA